MSYYWTLQYRRVNRWLRYWGVSPFWAYFLIPILLYFFVKLIYYKTEYAPYLVSLIFTSMVMPLSEKKRNNFLKSIYNKASFIKLRLIENMALAIPFSIYMCTNALQVINLLPLTIAAALAFYNNQNSISTKIPTPFSKYPFEFTVGFRYYWPIIILLYLLLFIGIYVNNFNLCIVVYAGLFLVTTSFYNRIESYFFLWIHTHTPINFLNSKIRIGILYSLITSTLGLFSLMIFFPKMAWLSLLITVIGTGYTSLAVVIKYTQYPRQFNLLNFIALMISIGFPFILFITIPFYYKKAISTLNLELL